MTPENRSILRRTVSVLDACLSAEEGMSLHDIAGQTGLPKTTVWRIAENLVGEQLLERTPLGYRGGAGTVTRGDRAARQRALRANVTPELVDLGRSTGAAVWAVDVRDDRDWVVVDSVYDRQAQMNGYRDAWDLDPSRPSVLATALGHVAMSRRLDLVEPLLRRGIPHVTRDTEINPHRVWRALEQAREQDAVVEHGRFWLGWSCAAVPILGDDDRVVGVVGAVDRTPRFDTTRVVRSVVAVADRMRRAWAADGAAA